MIDLTPEEIRSPLWTKLKEHFAAQRQKLRERNDLLSLEERETAALRGEIKAYADLLRIDTPKPPIR